MFRVTRQQTFSRPILTYSALVIFVLFCFSYVIADQVKEAWSGLKDDRRPDFNHYVLSKTLPAEHIPTDDTTKRIIAVGDIHGMNQSLHSLLKKVSYDPNQDTLIHLGDIAVRSSLSNSLAVLSFMANNAILGVRGNNDHEIIQWRTWINWISLLPGGQAWLAQVDDKLFGTDEDSNFKFKKWLKQEKGNKKWLNKIPDDWKIHRKHFEIARAMSQDHYEYLASLPLILHAPEAHTYFVHAGLLAYDLKHKPSHPDQPLSHFPTLPQAHTNVSLLRSLQEKALLSDIPQNKDPWVLMNMRSIKKNGKITKSNTKGSPWAKSWNRIMDRCSGFVSLDDDLDQLPCYPSTVVYGHAAYRDLDVNRWSIGLDTGCVYERELTALVLDWKSLQSSPSSIIEADENNLKKSPSQIPYGDHGQAQIVSVQCKSS
ncbi:hypothetical protein SERLADRAFT_467065 [Serpula lacrymans var. lacrymans S7.9]|uniref:Calcineurin-like phosphoesterase domain-containing protein n=1 Tax=Serpula lacrymans var. lacrymans (strain S7.9) TaxID=578457 RepID=F8NXY1_SERL9|nr:uncharacterized protein SERLADRAFT_467065 [Serpula lacrymans var. lacrymans S7.9]EGO24173.1 hypothetical protein SERLADRAFT_467065 [Serpula lacrymans var. lacrymans S7.9]